MEYKPLRPRDALNKAFLKVKPVRSEVERFKAGLKTLLEHVNPAESEEFHKNLLTDFLRKTGYDPQHFINTKGRNDLVIHNGDSAKSPVGVIIEAKNPSNQNEMLRLDRINVKAMQELLLYYLRERITNNNLELRYLVATNVYEWFIFDAQVFEQCFAKNKELVRVFRGFDDGRLAGTKTDYFYKEVAPHYINAALSELSFTHIDLRTVEKELHDGDKANDAKLIPLFKVLSPEHLLKLPFTNDSNTLDKRFYTELLHIIGLTERKEGGKKLIERKPEGARDAGSLLENAIIQLDSLDKVSRLEKPQQFGADKGERLFNVALELAITWTNRVLFLKLLEAQLISYHKGDRNYAFLNLEKVGSYDDLNGLFFEVLARTPGERSAEMKKRFGKVPYLNSSLFEPSAIEHAGLFISQIKDRTLPVHPATVLKDKNGKKRTGELDALEYFFAFLDAYDFTADGAEEIQEDNKTLINASVLGLIFEKINGYKDGSFFTPGFITMYMCRETIRRAVIQKFNQEKGWNCETVEQLADRIEDKADANRIINSLKICDPAVGSGHFLVSALNELIALKSELGVLCDRDGKRLKNYHVEVVNDELFVTDEDGEFFEYKPKLPESQRVQEMLFHEKQTIIENCLFGVDINPNSVKICRLRLWIELLKNAYYKAEDELETLPNIDINIKCGNSLISRFTLDSDLKKALKNSKWNISSYKLAVMSYRNAESKEQKRAMEKLIGDIKGNFEAEIYSNDPRVVKLRKLNGKLFELTNQTQMFELSKTEKAAWNKSVKKFSADIQTLEAEIEAVRSNKIYENAFEWRFEFPEVLDDAGSFVGFDAVIGNPPYGVDLTAGEFACLKSRYDTVAKGADSYALFMELAIKLVAAMGCFSMIVPTGWYSGSKFGQLRRFIASATDPKVFINLPYDVFADAWVDTTIVVASKREAMADWPRKILSPVLLCAFPKRHRISTPRDFSDHSTVVDFSQWFSTGGDEYLTSADADESALMKKVVGQSRPLSDFADVQRGVTPFHLTENPDHANSREAFNGTVRRYTFVPGDRKFIRYDESLAEFKPEKYFCGPRILLRELISRQFQLQAVKVADRFVTNKSMQSILPVSSELHLNYLLGVLNSKLLSWYFLHCSSIAQRDDFPKIVLKETRQLPIALPKDASLHEQMVVAVEKILALKKENPDADVSALETEIDRLVYKLYGLTDEEVKIVEGKVAMCLERLTV
jgi:hypothetical protein